jgi:methylated-DNA-protein-cysteine methyltransferase-like protein
LSDFEERVVEVLLRLQPGDVVTYGEVAEEAGYPGTARAVGTLLRRSGQDLPWWRVVGVGGRIRTPNPDRQARLLIAEGVRVVDHRVVSP